MYKAIDRSNLNARQWKLLARYELVLTLVELFGAIFFIIGSFCFLSEATMMFGTWLFIIGSFFFAMRPTIKFFREYHLYHHHQYQKMVNK